MYLNISSAEAQLGQVHATVAVTLDARNVGTDLSAVITWVGLGLSAAEPLAL